MYDSLGFDPQLPPMPMREIAASRRVSVNHILKQLIKHYASLQPKQFLVLSGRQSRYHYLMLDCHELSEAQKQQVPSLAITGASARQENGPKNIGFRRGLTGFLSYDDLAHGRLHASKLFFAGGAIVFDAKTYNLSVPQHPAWDDIEQKLDADEAASLHQSAIWSLRPHKSDDDYLSMITEAIEQIRQGRFYQINLLRYFDADGSPSFDETLQKFVTSAGPLGAWLYQKDFELLSFSPERFVHFAPFNEHISLLSEPIKGTAPGSPDPKTRASLGDALLQSTKDLAELHMIVDLLRNDMYQVSLPHSVKVEAPHELKDFGTVQHLVARIRSTLRTPISFGDILKALGPGGSITGAPKIEVMKAIQEFEGRPRGFFMGNAFLWDLERNFFDSSILIRTLQREHAKWHYAAGSGIVIRSSPEAELKEIGTKCQVVLR